MKTIGTKQRESWKRHGIAERSFNLNYYAKDRKKKQITSKASKDMQTLIVQIEDLGTIEKVTLYFDDYRDDRYIYLQDLVDRIKVERALDNFHDNISYSFNLDIYTEEEGRYKRLKTSDKEVFVDLAENIVSFICQKENACV